MKQKKIRKYYLNVCNDHLQDFIVATPFRTRAEAKAHKESLIGNLSVYFVKTIAFETDYEFELN